MWKLLILTQVFQISGAFEGTSVDYAQEANRYVTYPQYFQQPHPENPNPQHENSETSNPQHQYSESPSPQYQYPEPQHAQHHQQYPNPMHHYPEIQNPMEASQQPSLSAASENSPSLDERFGGIFFPPAPPPPGFDGGYGGPPHPPPGPMPPPPYGYPDPGFQTQTGFEGLLVPNTWYGLLPWGIEGVIIVIAGIIVFAIIVIAIIGLLAWLCGVKAAVPFIKTGEDAEARSRFGDQWGESFTNLSTRVLDAIETFNEVLDEEHVLKKAN